MPPRPFSPSGAARVKRILKYTWAHLWFDTGLLALVEWLRNLRPRGRPLAILMYHRVVPPEWARRVLSHPDIVVSAASFRQQVAFLAARYRVIPLADFVTAAQAGTPPPARAVVLTFDDGWEDNYQTAFPVLRAAGLSATVFLTAGLIGSREMFWQER
ncbi:MAG TPA: polysaccharide deacetylase family protein, partial [Candidatus Aminicenantes bacterium]|nr:polysaccharide deacetylase family protein [Candidatus Aminicenantes bacterium]